MREAIGSSLLFNIVIVIIIAIMIFFIGALSYSKAYKVKNRIIELIEKYEGYPKNEGPNSLNDLVDKEEIEEINLELNTMGYYNSDSRGVCTGDNLNQGAGYKYCVYLKDCSEYEQDSNGNYTSNCIGSRYYKVVAFVHFDFPLIGDYINIPVSGETKILKKDYNY